MNRNEAIITAHDSRSTLEEIDLSAMDGVSGGCQDCGCSGSAVNGSNQLATLPSPLANQNGSRTR